jgi:hypothetical protein
MVQSRARVRLITTDWGGVPGTRPRIPDRWTATKQSLCFKSVLPFDAGLGSVGDLCRATSGEGETEPKQIGEGTRASIEQLECCQGNMATHALTAR